MDGISRPGARRMEGREGPTIRLRSWSRGVAPLGLFVDAPPFSPVPLKPFPNAARIAVGARSRMAYADVVDCRVSGGALHENRVAGRS